MQTRNSFSVHTASGCEMGRRGYSGSFMMNSELATNCDAGLTQAQVDYVVSSGNDKSY